MTRKTRRQFLGGALQAAGLLACSPPMVLSAALAGSEESAMTYPLVPFSTVVDSLGPSLVSVASAPPRL